MKFSSRKELFLNVYYVVFFICLVYQFFSSFFSLSELYYDWNTTEWLINYQGGFVRRGIRGEFVYKLYQLFGWNPYDTIRFITGTSLFFIFFFFIKGFIRKGYPIIILPFVVFLGNPILNIFWKRTDSLLLIFFISILYLVKLKPRFYLLWVNLLTITAILIHEIFIFIAIPILFFILARQFSRRNSLKSYINSFLSLSPSLFIFMLVSVFKGTPETVVQIKESWKGIPFPKNFLLSLNKDYWGAVQAIGFDIKEGLSMPANFFRCFDSDVGLYGPVFLTLTIILIYLLLNNINQLNDTILGCKPTQINTTILSGILLFQFCTIAPLYFIGFDYSRWIFLWVCSSFILLIIIPEKQLINLLPLKFQNIATNLNYSLISITGNSKGLLLCILFLIGFPTYLWSLKGTLQSSSIYVILQYISYLVQSIMSAFGIEIIKFNEQ